MTDIFIDSARTKGDLAGVIEVDDETAYFYLCTIDGEGGSNIIGAINMGSDICQIPESEFEIGWSDDEVVVVALVNNEVYAAYELGSGPTFKKMLLSEVDPYIRAVFDRFESRGIPKGRIF